MSSYSRPIAIQYIIWFCALVATSTLAYLPGLTGSFLFDDFPNIVSNPRIHAETIGLGSLSQAARAYEPGPYGRPLATIGFAVDYYIGDGAPFVFKLHSLLVHLLNACLVSVLVLRLLRISGTETRLGQMPARWSAFLLALTWSIHPLQVSTVLYVVQRMEMLAATFVLLSVLAYIDGRTRQIGGRAGGWPRLALAAFLAAIGLLAKESAVAAPLFALVMEICVFGFKAKNQATRRKLVLLYAVGSAVAVVGLAWLVLRYIDGYTVREFGPLERLLTQSRVLVLYLSQTLLPFPSAMPFYYDNYPHSTGLLSPWTTAACTLLLAAIVGLTIHVRRRMPLFSLGVFWFFAAHVLTSGILPLEHVYEHRNYLALLGPLLAIYALGIELLPRLSTMSVARVVMAVLVLGLFSITLVRSMTWGDPVVLATDMVASNPGSSRASNDLATLYFSRADGDPDSKEWALAKHEFQRGAALPGSSPLPEQGLILMRASIGLPAELAWWESLLHKLRSRAISPQERMAVMGLLTQAQRGFVLDDQYLYQAYRILVERATLSAHDYCNIGDHAINRIGDREFGKEMFLTCARKSHLEPDFIGRMTRILVEDGHGDIADAVLGLSVPDQENHSR